MSFSKIMGAAMELLKIVNSDDLANESSFKSWPSPDGTSVVATDSIAYHNVLESLASDNSKIASRFSRKTARKFIEDRLPRLKRSAQIPESSESFFKELLDQQPTSMTVSVPISGIRLDGGAKSFELACFRFGYLQDLLIPMANQPGMYISTTIKDAYDKEVALKKAENAFLNFAKLIIFLSGKHDQSILIETGLPLKPDLSHERMYVSTNSYQIQDEQGRMSSADVKNTHIEKIPVNNEFFTSNELLGKLWGLYERKHAGIKLGDLEARIINTALALGESASTKDIRNSILYTCIALEILFSRDDGALFQKSIGQNVADLFAFIVAKEAPARKEIAKLTKKVYGMRSAIVHGGDKEMSSENLLVNHFMRGALGELLTAERFKDAKRLSTIYEMMLDAQYSY
ncbi:HEPN domain-containing protein [Pseudomonas chlororaphis]|uniref:HEPN domain-containing protein n=1 Tax=Pseudomonas chlororaphis TaxID=587753 RepID=UPI000470DC50|nr:HEPN domain-containing protein [Pseudomonas chlororaphis]